MTVASSVIDAELRTDGPAGVEFRRRVIETFEAHWRAPGFVCPNADRYPWMWLWDSCFHAVVWAQLGEPDRAINELRSAFAGQDPVSGFVPHMAYFGASPSDAAEAAEFWGRPGARSPITLSPITLSPITLSPITLSSITQPPMYGHAVAELLRRGVAVPDDVASAALAGLRFLLEDRRRHRSGLIELVHPWESGCDDSPRWDDVVPDPWSVGAWREAKGTLLDSIDRTSTGAPVGNARFAVASVGFNALVAFNAAELAAGLDDRPLADAARQLVAAVEARWDPAYSTWTDAGPTEGGSGRCRTLDALLPVLVAPRPEAFDQLGDPMAFGAPFGPRGVHLGEAVHEPGSYWRGPAWPQLSYLLWLAARRDGRHALAQQIGSGTAAAASLTGLAEYWDADTGAGGGAVPQSWTALALLMTPDA